MSKHKVAIVHYWLTGMRGGEAVLEALCRMFPSADLFTHVYNQNAASPTINKHTVTTTFIDRLPFANRLYAHYLPLMPIALEGLDLTSYDLVISSEAGPAKGVITAPGSVHICYTHSPMRYIWDQYHVYRKEASWFARILMPVFAHHLRIWDESSAARVDGYIANSNHVANRVRKYYRREAIVIPPPVAINQFTPESTERVEDFYLWAGELVSYKRPSIAIDAFTVMNKPLVVIGGGKPSRELISRAGKNITFLGRVPHDVLKDHMARCRALVFPGEEDFGIVPIEVMASGRPVIAYSKGGAVDTVVDGVTGLLFDDQSVEGLVKAVQHFESEMLHTIDQQALAEHARNFDENHFRERVSVYLNEFGIDADNYAVDGK